jgi:hypothetical protein
MTTPPPDELRGIPIREYTGDNLPDGTWDTVAALFEQMAVTKVRRELVIQHLVDDTTPL